jgi:hypothetical protein
MPPEIETIAAVVGGLINILVKKRTLTKSEAKDILEKAEGVLIDPEASINFPAREMIRRIRANLPEPDGAP